MPEQQRKKDVLVGEYMPVNPNNLTPEQRSKADVYVGEDAMAGQYVPSWVMPEQVRNRSYIFFYSDPILKMNCFM